jgi:hypothetical protein
MRSDDEKGARRPAPPMSGGWVWAIFGAFVVTIGGLVAIAFAFSSTDVACDYGGCETPSLYYVQIVVACLGLIPVGVLVWATLTRRREAATAALLIAIACYAIWGVLNDRAVHGGDIGAALVSDVQP